ncbi:MAG TPA: S9 family peptidase [Candidatus Baltobacteraceae bacterium]
MGSLVLCATAVNAAPVTLESLHKFVHLSDVSISPDGKQVAFVRSIGDYQHDRFVRTLSIVPTSGGAVRSLLMKLDELKSLQWSPANAEIAYIASGAHRVEQVFAIPAAGGTPRQITHAAKDVEQFSWNPKGTLIAYVTEDGPSDPVAAKRHDDLWEVHDVGFLQKYESRPSHIWIISAQGGAARRLTQGSWSYLEADPPFVGAATDPSWSPDGRGITFTMQANAYDSDSDRTSIAEVDVRTGKIAKLDSRTTYEYEPQFAPEGHAITYLYPHGPGPVSVLDVYVAEGAANDDVTQTFDHDVTGAWWLSGKRMLLTANDGIDRALYLLQLPKGTPRRLPLGRLNPVDLSISNDGKIAMIASATDVPPEIYVMNSVTAVPRTLTNINAAVAVLDLGRSEEVTFKASDGERSDGILTYPVGYQPGKKYPLVLRIHGGPEAASVLAWEDLRQLFASRGYLVFEPDYRGSDNLGTAHEHAIYKDPGVGPGRDVIAGVEAVEKLGIVDTSREAVTGHSYGGYMTAWMIGHYQKWRSAVIGDGVFDWVEAYDLSATGNLAWTRDSLGGSPWNPQNAQLYRDGSPITYVRDIKTPTRLISGTADDQAPVVGSYQLYHALADQGVPVSFVAIPNAFHFPRDPVHIEGYNRVTLEWVDRYMK